MTSGYQDQAIGGEGYGPCGAIVLVMGRNWSAAQRAAVREILAQHGGHGGGLNSVAYLFHPVGLLRYPSSARLAERALAAGAESVQVLAHGETEVATDPADWESVREALATSGHLPRLASITWRTAQPVRLEPQAMHRVQALLDALRALEGVEAVYTNAEPAVPAGSPGTAA